MMSLLIYPLIACVALVLMHVYFGSFVLKRGVIFIDLALAQWAALGYLVGAVLHIHSPFWLFTMGFGFTLIASLFLVFMKNIYPKVHMQEAVIGVIYISASSIATALIATIGMEGHHLQEMLSGHLLFIQKSELITAVLLYTVIGACLFKLHQYFLHQGSKLWDFVFYALFGLVVTSSVKMVGLLLVFSYLVLPLLTVLLFTKSFKTKLFSAWVLGLSCSVVGLFMSVIVDIPPSYCIIISLIVAWLLAIVIRIMVKQNK